MFSRQVAVGCHDAQAAEGIFRCLLTWTRSFSSALLGYIDSEVFSQSITAFMEIPWNDRGLSTVTLCLFPSERVQLLQRKASICCGFYLQENHNGADLVWDLKNLCSGISSNRVTKMPKVWFAPQGSNVNMSSS